MGSASARRAGSGPGVTRENSRGKSLSPGGMEEAMTSVLAETDPIKRQRRFSLLIESLTAENAEAAVRALQEAPRSRWNWGQEFSLLNYAWGRVDGPAAVAFAKEQEGRTREWTMSTVLAGWASNNPDEAKKWVAGIEDKEEQRNFTRGLVYGLAQRDVDAATSYVLSLPRTDDNRPAEYMSHIARQQLSQGVEIAAEWSSSLPDGKLKGSALEAVAGEYVRRNPEEAARWASQFAEEDYATGAIAEISDEWAEDDPQSALDWVTTLPEGNTRSRALGETISEWAREKPADAGEYLAAMPSGSERDTAISYYSRRVVYQEPAAAIEWAQSIE
ncbi:MAG: hypothetical protein GWO24_29200, partial [Akkermansiaceae bacterium]|nr:hypothetical protein [Akkermansiaceae bacterium]